MSLISRRLLLTWIVLLLVFTVLPLELMAKENLKFDSVDVPSEPPPKKGNYRPDALGLGWIAEKSGRHQDALRFFKWHLKYFPNDAEAYFGIAYVFSVSGQLDDAIKFYREALKLDPNYTHANANLGYALLQKGQSAEGLKFLDKALSLDPKCGIAYLSYSNYYARKGDWEKAGEYARKAIESGTSIDPEFAEILKKHKVQLTQ
jgi:tetratricopeptide (TPR) repeat protein